MDLTAVLIRLLPPGDVEWSLDGNDLDGLTIHTDGVSAPTQAECDAKWAEIKPILRAAREDRAKKERTRMARLDAVVTAANAANSVPALRTQVAELIAIVKELASR